MKIYCPKFFINSVLFAEHPLQHSEGYCVHFNDGNLFQLTSFFQCESLPVHLTDDPPVGGGSLY